MRSMYGLVAHVDQTFDETGRAQVQQVLDDLNLRGLWGLSAPPVLNVWLDADGARGRLDSVADRLHGIAGVRDAVVRLAAPQR